MKKLLSILAATGFCSAAMAQDVQLTQLHQVPVLLNPALTGLMDGSVRVSGAYRNTHLGSGMSSYQSGALAAEARIKGGFVPADDRFGIGVYGYMDQSSAGALKSSYVGLSLAYNKSLSAGGSTRLGVGAQAVYASRRLDMSKVYFEDQVGSGGVTTLPSKDPVQGGSDSHFDVNAGLHLSHDAATWGGSVGGSVLHLTRPKEGFWSSSYQLPLRWTGNASLFWKLGQERKDKLTVMAIYSTMEPLSYLQGGVLYQKDVQLSATPTSVTVGVLARDTRALIPYLGLSYGRTTGAVTYDLTTRKEKQAGIVRQSLELSLSHTF